MTVLERHSVRFESKSLDVGDMWLMEAGTDTGEGIETWHRRLVIERKTRADLANSIRDGRYREQSARLQALEEGVRVMYIIENGGKGGKVWRGKGGRGGVSDEALMSAQLGLRLRDNFRVVEVVGLEGTATVMRKILGKWTEWSSGDRSTKPMVKLVKKDGLTPAECYVHQLAMIPGISVEMARLIATHYPNWIRLSGAQVLELQNLEMKSRRLGPAVARRIIDYCQGCGEARPSIETRLGLLGTGVPPPPPPPIIVPQPQVVRPFHLVGMGGPIVVPPTKMTLD